MLTIRLQRTGKRNKVHFRLVLAEKTAHASKKFVEVLGSYNPHTKALLMKNQDRLNYWVSQHVSMSPTAHNLLVTHKFLEKPKIKAFNIPKKAVAAETPKAEAKPETADAPAEAPGSTETPVEVTGESPTETETQS